MLLRFFGSAAVVIGCVGLGFYYSAKEGFRTAELLAFKKALLILSSEIEYVRSPLAVACANIAARTGSLTGLIFGLFSEFLTVNNGETAYQLWIKATNSIKEKSYLTPKDFEMIEGFGKTIGYLDKNMQQNAIDYAISYIDEKAVALQISSEKNKRMYRSLGLIGGLLITVVLW